MFGVFFYLIVLGIVIHFTRATALRAWGAVTGGAAVSIVGIGVEWKCEALGFWRYPFSSSPYGPSQIYPAVLLQFAVIALLGWRATWRWGRRGLTFFLLAITGCGAIRDYSYAWFWPGLMTLKPGLTNALRRYFVLGWFDDVGAGSHAWDRGSFTTGSAGALTTYQQKIGLVPA